MKRATVLTGIVLVAFASGCGGGSDAGNNSAADSGSQAPAAAATSQVSDGQLGGAVVARPGGTKTRGGVEKITGKLILPPNGKNALGAEDKCTDVDVQPTPQNLPHVSDVIFCLMNAMRANAGVPALRQQDLLAKASVEHSQDMVDNKYFAHDSQDGRDVVARLKAVAYIPKSGEWVIGENLAWGSGTLASPKALVNAWMNSPPHRENLLSGDFVEVGMGVVSGTPSKDADEGVTVTTDFGTRPNSASATGSATDSGVDLGNASGSDASDSGADGSAGAVAGQRAAAAKRAAAKRTAKRVAAKRKRALRRCARKHGNSKRHCVRAARRIHR